MLKISNLNFGYGSGEDLVLRRINATFNSGELSLLIGPTGSGKSTFLKTIIRLIPDFSSGTASGSISHDGLELSEMKSAAIAPLIGYVNQQPDSYFVSESVIDELAFGMEQLGLQPEEMRKRIREISEKLDIQNLLERDLFTLSAGQAQKVAIGAALAAGQQILLLDEPSSALDDIAAAELLVWLNELTKNHGYTVIICEHRFERVLTFTDKVLIFKGDGSTVAADPNLDSILDVLPFWRDSDDLDSSTRSGALGCRAEGLSVEFENSGLILDQISIDIMLGEVISIQGPNGSGKSTLLMALSGNLELSAGTLTLSEQAVIVPQNASDLLFLSSVAEELSESDTFARVKENSTSKIFEALVGRIDPKIHPRDLSTGQQLALVIALQLIRGANILLLDEPTRGLDRSAKKALARQILRLSEAGAAVVLATHDSEFAQLVATRSFKIAKGKLSIENRPNP